MSDSEMILILKNHFSYMESSVRSMDDEVKKKIFLTIKWLPFYLINKNESFTKYLRAECRDFTNNQLGDMLKLLTHHLSQTYFEFGSRIRSHNQNFTEKSFKHDTEIFDDFNVVNKQNISRVHK
jgi:hypothetical protein